MSGFSGLEKQMLREWNRQINGRDSELVTIKYLIKRPEVTNENWQKTEGVVWQYNNVRCLKEVISELAFADSNIANTLYGKSNFRFDYLGYDFHNNVKRFITIIDSMGQLYDIEKIVPQVRIGNRWQNWCAIQK